MEDRPKVMRCNYCGREVSDQKSITWIPLRGLGENYGIWYAECRYCRAVETRRKHKRSQYK